VFKAVSLLLGRELLGLQKIHERHYLKNKMGECGNSESALIQGSGLGCKT
jgi:hypothetical protein